MALIFDPAGVGFYDTGSGALGLPRGTTAQRPAYPQQGYMRYNTDLQMIEIYGSGANASLNIANSWGTYVSGNYLAEVLMVAGGGAGTGPGGGGGGVIYTTSMALTGGQNYPVIIGSGGVSGSNGQNTTFNGHVAIGGGGAYATGGSGGGYSYFGHGQWGASPSGLLGQGYPGGCGYANHDWGHSYGGGGGAGGTGNNGTSGPGGGGGGGGSGQVYTITGSSTYYAGGGGATQGARTHYGGGGAGGGGGGGASGYDNSGGGGSGNSGGSGIVIITYQGYPRAMGGEITFRSGVPNYTTHVFRTSGNFIA